MKVEAPLNRSTVKFHEIGVGCTFRHCGQWYLKIIFNDKIKAGVWLDTGSVVHFDGNDDVLSVELKVVRDD